MAYSEIPTSFNLDSKAGQTFRCAASYSASLPAFIRNRNATLGNWTSRFPKPSESAGALFTIEMTPGRKHGSVESKNSDGKIVDHQLVRTYFGGSGGLKSCCDVHIVEVAASSSRNGNMQISVALVHQQHSAFASLGYNCKGSDIRMVRRNLHYLVARAKVVMQKLQYPYPCVCLSVVPIDHGYAWKLRGIADQLRFSRDVNPQPCELRKNICILCARKIPIRIRNGLCGVGWIDLCNVIGRNDSNFINHCARSG